MRPLIVLGGIAASAIALVLGTKKKASAAEASIDAEVTPEGAAEAQGTVIVPPSVLVPTGSALPSTSTVVKSPGLPPLPTLGTGPTSGATSVTKTGVLDDGFDELLANAIAKGDISLLEQLAQNAEARGLTEAAESIREEIARIKGAAPTPTVATAPKTAPIETYLGRATISMKAGSKGPDVVEWQRIVNVKQDGIFGPITDAVTRAWQKAHTDPSTGKPLVVDGIVGPRTWASAYAVQPTLATAPRTTAPVPVSTSTAPAPAPAPAPTTTTYPTIKLGSRGEAVKQWQTMVGGLTVDGIFGSLTDRATRDFQRANGLVVDGIVGPKTWGKMLVINWQGWSGAASTPTPAPAPTTTSIVESDSRKAAREITEYLKSIGGLAGRRTEDRTRIKGYQTRLGVTADGSYGRNSAKAVIIQGFVPVVPFYWPTTGTQTAKNEFTAYVKQYADNDTGRAAEWNALLADITRS